MSQQRGLRILVAVDGSVHSEAALKLTAGITWPAGTIAHVLAVVPERWWLSEISQAPRKVLVETLEALWRADWKAAAWFAGHDSDSLRVHGLAVEVEVCEGRPSEIILDRAVELAADLLVIGAKGLTDGAVSAPVIACPPPSDAFPGLDVFSSLRMPSGIAPAVVLEPMNATLFAAKILGLTHP